MTSGVKFEGDELQSKEVVEEKKEDNEIIRKNSISSSSSSTVVIDVLKSEGKNVPLATP